MKIKVLFLCCLFSIESFYTKAQNGLSSTLFRNPPSDNRVHTWWHFVDNYITKEGITKDLEAMRKQGIQGATILSVNRFNGTMGEETVKFNTPAWFDMFSFALKEASRLNLEIGVHNCDGWSTSGGPWITPATSMKQYVWRKKFVSGGKNISVKLEQPFGNNNFYKDAYVVAYKTPKPATFYQANPSIQLEGKNNGQSLIDGCPVSNVSFKIAEPILIGFKEAFTANKLLIHTQRNHSRNGTLQTTVLQIEASLDGTNFTNVGEVRDTMVNETTILSFAKTTAKFFRVSIKELLKTTEKEMRIGELALLNDGERGLYQPSMYAHQAKTVAVSPNDMADFYGTKQTNNINDVIGHASEVINITDNVKPDGTLSWNAPVGDWTVIRFGYTTTGKKIHPATKEGEGLECDKMDTAVLNLHFKSFPQKLIDAAGHLKGKTFSYLLVDSWEAYYQNWTDNFGNEFEKRRGYSLVQYIPVLCGEVVQGDVYSEAFLHDFRKTVADLIEENFFKHMADLCHRQGLKLHSESIYGGVVFPPLDILKSYSYFDVPMTEFWAPIHAADTPFYFNPADKMVATIPTHASLLYNKTIIASEAYTGFGLYSASPWDIKLYGDQAFTEGVNRLVLHSYVHQPNEKKPGMTLGMYGLEFNRHNTWWPYASAYFDQQTRVQYMLQQGHTVSDLLVYTGDKLPYRELKGKTTMLLPGVRYTYVNADVLYNRISVAPDGSLMLDNKIPFLFLVVNDEVLDLATLQKLELLVRAGATLIAPKPTSTLSLSNFESNNKALKKTGDSMWGEKAFKSFTRHNYGKGKVISGATADKILQEESFIRDLEIYGADLNEIMYIHKKVEDEEVYYIVNKNNTKQIQVEARFRVTGKKPEVWDPVDGKAYKQALYIEDDKTTTLPLSLRPRQSVMVVFKKGQNSFHLTSLSTDDNIQLFPALLRSANVLPAVCFDEKNNIRLSSDNASKYHLVSSKGKVFKVNVNANKVLEISSTNAAISLDDEKQVVPFTTTEFQSLASNSDPLVKYYSGSTTYSFDFTLPLNFVGTAQQLFMQLGQFGSTASIQINGMHVQTIWEPGYKVNITDAVKKGENKAIITVTNPWRNRLIGDLCNANAEKKAWTSSPLKGNLPNDIVTKDSPLLPSGISSPIKIYSVHTPTIEVE